MNSVSSTASWLPMLKTAYGAPDAAHGPGGRASTRTTPSTMSSTNVKSRRILPWLNTLIGSPARIALVNSIGAMSGRPQGP